PAFDPAALPPIESLTPESDIRDFLRAEVPEALRRAALRRLWVLDPAIRGFVGPADYAWDFNAPGGAPGFAPALGGDAARLIARALGPGQAGPAPERAAPEPAAAPPPAEPALSGGEAPAGSPAPPAVSLPAPPATAAVPERAAGAAERAAEGERPAERRRHGGALPA
ncbi:DUF3306 domain-containing protein, partial [Caldovatus aquaticus]